MIDPEIVDAVLNWGSGGAVGALSVVLVWMKAFKERLDEINAMLKEALTKINEQAVAIAVLESRIKDAEERK